jgi:meso-butanediol dehydrogenase/(S,S)-butanediol dehydrogenase/diacetyl reductase
LLKSHGRLAGKIALITGVAGGQARAACELFAAEGARIIGCDINEAGALKTAELVRRAGGDMRVSDSVDLADRAASAALVEWAASLHGGFDLLYNVAANYVRGRLLADITAEEWQYSFANELSLMMYAMQLSAPVMAKRGGGSIVNVASVGGMVGSGRPGNAYGALVHGVFKGALLRLTECAAIELAPLGIRVNAVSPGPINTAILGARVAQNPRAGEAFAGTTLLGRLGTVRDVAGAALFLLSDEAAYITGVNLPVDGGFSASGGLGAPSAEMNGLFSMTDPPSGGKQPWESR